MSRKLLCMGCVVVVGVILASTLDSPRLVIAQDGGEPPPQRPLYHHAVVSEAVSPTVNPGQVAPLAATQSTLLAPNFLTFQSLYSSFELMLFDFGTGQLHRLTNNSFSESTPRLNQDASMLVYSANPDSNDYQIYTMNVDGSNVQKVGAIGGDAYSPDWSPDSGHIVFASNWHDAEGELYTMNSNGYGILRLTNNITYDGQPSWSPDGSKIAYISYATGGYRVWVMNADGSSPIQLSLQAYSAHPVWSPDGSQIVYDSDGDGDGWQELWLMNADGTNQREIYDYGVEYYDTYASGWNPGAAR